MKSWITSTTSSGPVKRPGVYEIPMGLPLRDLIFGDDYCQGMLDGIELKACIPGGSSVPVLTAEETMQCECS